jgi:demethoxyubiquinone hydroxylase (CLK1/Coq7/Cat5 family)
MKKDQDLLRVLYRNLDVEMKNVRFYAEHIPRLHYDKNKKEIDHLMYGSIEHMKKIIKEIIKVHKTDKPITKKMIDMAVKEEVGLQEIYKYQLSKVENPDVKRLLKKLINEEKEHEKTVFSLE